MKCKCGSEMIKDGDVYTLKGDIFQKYICPSCKKEKSKLIYPFWKKVK